MNPQAPCAAEIRALRPELAHARAAAAHLGLLTGLPDDARGDDPNDLVAERVAEAAAWAGAPAGATVRGLRAALAAAAAEVGPLSARLEALQHAQHHALEHPEHADLLADIQRQSAEREGLAARARDLTVRSAALRAAVRAFEEAPGADDPSPDDALTADDEVARATRDAVAIATADALAEVLDAVRAADFVALPARTPDDAAAAAAWRGEVRRRLGAALDALAPDVARTEAGLAHLDAHLEALLG